MIYLWYVLGLTVMSLKSFVIVDRTIKPTVPVYKIYVFLQMSYSIEGG